MATEFQPYVNLRIIWTPTGTITDFRDGIPATGSPVVIEAYAAGQGRTTEDTPGVKAGLLQVSGYICRYAPLPEDGWLVAAEDFTWVETGVRPAGLLPGAKGQAFRGDLAALPVVTVGGERGELQFLEIGGKYGVGGIGAEERESLGDGFVAVFGTSLS